MRVLEVFVELKNTLGVGLMKTFLVTAEWRPRGSLRVGSTVTYVVPDSDPDSAVAQVSPKHTDENEYYKWYFRVTEVLEPEVIDAWDA